MIGFNRRFDPHFLTLKKSIEEGKIGDVEILILTSRDPGLPPVQYLENSGGLFKDMTIHDFDMAAFLLGELPTEIYSTASVLVDQKLKNINDYDTASLILNTKSGKQIIINNSRSCIL